MVFWYKLSVLTAAACAVCWNEYGFVKILNVKDLLWTVFLYKYAVGPVPPMKSLRKLFYVKFIQSFTPPVAVLTWWWNFTCPLVRILACL